MLLYLFGGLKLIDFVVVRGFEFKLELAMTVLDRKLTHIFTHSEVL